MWRFITQRSVDMDFYSPFIWFGILNTFIGYVLAEVVITPVNASISENDPVTLTCTSLGTTEKAKSISWLLRKRSETVSVAVGILISPCQRFFPFNTSLYEYTCPNSGHITWTIKKVTRHNHGDRYQCNIETSSGNQNSGYTFLNVKVPISSVSMKIPNTSVVTVKENVQTLFQCKTSGGRPAATVTWFKDSGTPGDPSDDTEITSSIENSSSMANDLVEVTGTLRYSPTKTDNGWRIYCAAYNTDDMAPLISVKIPLLNVHYTPVIEPLRNRTVVEGSPLTVSCPVIVGNPPKTTFEWERNGQIWKTSEEFTIDATSRTDAMFYTCKVTNRVQQTGEQPVAQPDTSSFYLNVLYKTSITSFFIEGHRGQPNVVLDELDEDIQFICTVESNPVSNVKIMFEGSIFKEMSNTKNISFVRSHVTCIHRGVYSCEGNNSYGQPSSQNLTLFVRCSPRPNYKNEQNITGSIHAPVTLSFTALAYPEPGPSGFSWHKEQENEWSPIFSNADVHITSTAIQSNLTILYVSKIDFGRYRLIVRNSIGSYVKYFFLSDRGSSNANISKCEKDINSVILGITLGLVCAVLAVYAASLTVMYKRNKASKALETRPTNESTKQTTYANLSFTPNISGSQDTDDDPRENNTGDLTEVEDDTTRQYTGLVRHSKDDRTTYDVIQTNE